MTTSYARFKLNHIGTLGTASAQSFSWGLNFVTSAPTDENDLINLLEDIRDLFDAANIAANGPKAWIGTTDSYSAMSLYYYTAGSDTAAFVAEVNEPVFGTGGSHNPFQTSIVASLMTGRSGRHNRGRSYLPATGKGLSTGNQWVSSDCDDLAVAMAAYLSAINDLTFHLAPVTVIVPSTASSTGIPVTQVRVDSRPDIQRRRANKEAPLFVRDRPVSV